MRSIAIVPEMTDVVMARVKSPLLMAGDLHQLTQLLRSQGSRSRSVARYWYGGESQPEKKELG